MKVGRLGDSAEGQVLVGANTSKTKPARLIAYIIADDGAEPTV
jgi:hypothetical protein